MLESENAIEKSDTIAAENDLEKDRVGIIL